MGINLTCPQCGNRMSIDLATTAVMCKQCGFKRGTGLDEKAAEMRAKGPRREVTLSNEDDYSARAVSLFYSAHDAVFAGDMVEAIDSLQDAIDLEPEMLDAHLWMAKLSDDQKTKRDHLSTILAIAPGHPEAIQMMLVLNGRLTSDQTERALKSEGPVLQRAETPVTATTKTLRCPNCNGDMTVNEESGQAECRFCWYAAPIPRRDTASPDSLVAALLERRAQPVQWVIGERLLHCKECGAERTIAADQLSTRCPFCDSNQVIEQDALGSFTQPDGILPFKIRREEAGALIKERLKGVTERVKGWFDNNKVAKATLNGYYLPYWIFDAMVEVTRTRIDNRPTKDSVVYNAPYQQTKQRDALYDVGVCAVKSPAPDLTRQLGDYNVRGLMEYEPNLLAKYPAQLYTIDFDKAALEARSAVANVMRARYTQRELKDDKVSINVFTNVDQMSFRLVLVPVWIATLVEEDKDHRMALVNGQTGRVVLGKTEKYQR